MRQVRRRAGSAEKPLYDDRSGGRQPSARFAASAPINERVRDSPRPARSARRRHADGGALLSTLRHLWPYIWPADRRDLKARVVFATVLIFVAKLATIAVPFTFKWATDALAGHGTAPVGARQLARLGAGDAGDDDARLWRHAHRDGACSTQWRDGIFAKVAMHAVRRLAMLTFEHMHLLSLRFHLERKTGGLTRVLERGRNAIETIVRMVLLQLLADHCRGGADRLRCCCSISTGATSPSSCSPSRSMSAFTFYATEWRIGIRRKMNESDTDANAKAIDSLLNYETVKYFSAEEREAKRYDRSMARYEDASVKAYVSLAVLNAGQAIVFTHRARRRDGAVRLRHRARHQYGRRFRHDQRHDDPALPAAEFHGHGLSRDQTGGDRHRDHVLDPGAQAGDRGPAGRAAAQGARRHHPLRQRLVRLRAGAADPQRLELRGRGRAAPSPSSARPAPANRRSRGCCSASTTSPAAAS